MYRTIVYDLGPPDAMCWLTALIGPGLPKGFCEAFRGPRNAPGETNNPPEMLNFEKLKGCTHLSKLHMLSKTTSPVLDFTG